MEDRDLADHIIERQVVPQLRARELGVETRFASTEEIQEGVRVNCQRCGRESWMIGVTAEELPNKVILCPDCIP